MIDYHIHTRRCRHATGSMEEYLAEAKKKELLEIGFADHFPVELLGVNPEDQVNMDADELPHYLADVERIKEMASMPVRTGIEVDFLPGREEITAGLLARYPFDYVTGSIHFMDGWDFTHPGRFRQFSGRDLKLVYEQYFVLVEKLAASRLFDIIGHLDVVKKFGFFPREDWSWLVDRTCRSLAGEDICVELNTAGWRAPVREQYPSEAFLQKCLEYRVPVTLGSDAHRPGEVGDGLERAVALIEKIGFTEVAVFNRRERTMLPLKTL